MNLAALLEIIFLVLGVRQFGFAPPRIDAELTHSTPLPVPACRRRQGGAGRGRANGLRQFPTSPLRGTRGIDAIPFDAPTPSPKPVGRPTPQELTQNWSMQINELTQELTHELTQIRTIPVMGMES